LAKIIDVPPEEVVWRCGGINHMAWMTELSWKGKDLYPILIEAMKDKKIYKTDPIRFEIMKHFGYFVTESSGHFSEYVPYFRKRKDLIKKFCRERYLGESGFYSRNWPKWRKKTDKVRRNMADGKRSISLKRSIEFAADIIEAHLFDKRKIIYASVANTGLITNLPQTGVVEVAVVVDKRGFTPCYFG
ncbi:unnamed protein product, partial [marine sediment metagenome]